MDFLKDLKTKFNAQTVLIQLIISIVVTSLMGWLLKEYVLFIYDYLVFPASFTDFIFRPWTIISYGFIHGGLRHLLINMLILYVSGRIMINLFNKKQFLSLFFIGIVVGAIVYLLGQSLFPDYVNSAGLVGASAGVYAVAMFVCAFQPDNEVRLLFFNIKLRYIGYVLIGLSLLGLFRYSNNAELHNIGGALAHIGGLLVGFYTGVKMRDGDDILTGVYNWATSIVSFNKKAKMKTVYRNQSAKKKTPSKSDQQAQIDAILDKISESGYEALSKAEKEFLFKAGKE